jgi:hypothetical protein
MNALRSFLSLALILAIAAVSVAAVPPAHLAAQQPAVASAPAPASPAAVGFAAYLSRVEQPAPIAAPPAGFEPPSFGCGLSCIQQCQFFGCQPTCVNNLNCFCHCGP